MRTNQITVRSPLAIAAALLLTSAGLVAAGETPTAKWDAAKVIQLHAPNSATMTVTVWRAQSAPPSRPETKTTKGGATRLIELHAAQNATFTVTVWNGK